MNSSSFDKHTIVSNYCDAVEEWKEIFFDSVRMHFVLYAIMQRHKSDVYIFSISFSHSIFIFKKKLARSCFRPKFIRIWWFPFMATNTTTTNINTKKKHHERICMKKRLIIDTNEVDEEEWRRRRHKLKNNEAAENKRDANENVQFYFHCNLYRVVASFVE